MGTPKPVTNTAMVKAGTEPAVNQLHTRLGYTSQEPETAITILLALLRNSVF